MWLEEVDELLKGILPYYVLLFLPIFIIVSPSNPVMASHEFPVYRMQQFDLNSVTHGCRSATINLEARSLYGWSTSRHCIITRLQDLTIDHYHNIRSKAGALLVAMPQSLTAISNEDREHLIALENAMLAEEVSIPVYFVPWNEQLDTILQEISSNNPADDKTKSALEAIISSVAANLYQVVVNAKTPSVRSDLKLATIQGSLMGKSHDGKVPTIAIVAHYDSFGVVPELSFGADSNASGVTVLLELARLFSKLYSDPRSHGRYHIVFLLTAAGKLNYQGTKRWLEDQLEAVDGGSIIQDASYVLCLDTLTTSSTLHMHVSKPPKEGSSSWQFHQALTAAAERHATVTVEGVHKKINLADDVLAWEHERFSIRRLPAFTLSSMKSHKTSDRNTILDVADQIDFKRLAVYARIIAEALASQVYNISAGDIFENSLQVDKSSLQAWLTYLSGQPRAAQILSNKDNPVVPTLRETFSKYLRDVKVSYVTPEKRDPDFQFYDVTQSILNIYNVKPAVFDLVLTIAIVLYLLVIYLAIQNFPLVYTAVCGLIAVDSKKAH